MSRFRDEDLAYGDLPQRWDRARFERFGRGGGKSEEDDFRFVERDSPGRREIAVAIREKSRGPEGRFEERERDRVVEDDRFGSRRRRRTDKELFGDIDPKELVSGALMPYRRPREEHDIEERRSSVRPGIVRRQSSLDTFDRKPRYEREEPRIPPYTPIPLPVRRRVEEWYEPEDYREVEIQRERSVHRRGGRPPKSEAGRSVKEEIKSVSKHDTSSSSSSSFHEVEKEETVRSRAPTTVVSKARSRAPTVHESIHETSIHEDIRAPTVISKAKSTRAPSVHESFHETKIHEEFREPSVRESAIIEESIREERKWKKGKTKMPKRMVVREAIMDFGYPYHEDDNFFFLHCALEKEAIDEVIATSEMYKKGEKTYRAEEKIVESESVPRPPPGEHEEIRRREWINPPTIIAEQLERRGSPSAKSSISRRMSRSRSRRPSSPTFVEERKTVIEDRSGRSRAASRAAEEIFEERQTFVEERAPSHHHRHHHDGSLVLAERESRSDRDINAEIRNLEAERRALRLEREADEKHAMAERIRHNDELQLVEWREPRRRSREYLEIIERDRTPERKVVRVEKDRKGRLALVRSAH